MRDLIVSIEFWIAMALAVVLKLRASPTITVFGAITTTIAAVSSALIFTDPVLEWLNADRETYTYAVAALVALTGEHLMRQLLTMKLADLIGLGGKK